GLEVVGVGAAQRQHAQFAQWHDRGGMDLAGVRGPKVRRKLPEVLDVDEAAALVEGSGEGALAVRDRAMLELFYSSGLRLSELTGLRWGDLHLDEGEVRVLGKGRKTRLVPVGRYAVTALRTLGAAEG
ncbi:tyrosine-type recombinase/integrase, partial [Staphylococcus aureus]|uniref:tyrosine-type recombinase/integrase n=1 Tax=Staphylococcus aureus TaxID=1280 RepID=UPI0039BDDFE1